MRKAALIASVLFVAVVSTACINNFAVQDLNNKAKEYAQKGDYIQAVERLKSSIDLDSSVVETHYNLAVTYTQMENYLDAVEEFKKVISLKPAMADAYYSLATAQNNLAVDMNQGKVRMTQDGSLFTPNADELAEEQEYNLSEMEKDYIEDLYESAIDNYEKYLELAPNAADKAEVEEQIKKLEEYKAQDED